MQLRHLTSSGVIVEGDEISVLCDPWLLDGAFYGAWNHYPPLAFEPEDYDHVDYIYLSRAHPGRFHPPTLERLGTDIPVLVHEDAPDRLVSGVERLGFDLVELPDADQTDLDGTLSVEAVSASARSPLPDGRGGRSSPPASSRHRRPGIAPPADSAAPVVVFDDGESVLVNASACRWPAARGACDAVADRYGDIDALVTPYAAADYYPQCRIDYAYDRKLAARDEVVREMYAEAEAFVNALEPDYFLPVADGYALGGQFARLDEYVALRTRNEAFWHFAGSPSIEPAHSIPVLLNSEEALDLETGVPSANYVPTNRDERREYVRTELAERELAYECDDRPGLADFRPLLPDAYENLEAKRTAIGWESETTVVIDIGEGTAVAVSMSGGGYELVDRVPVTAIDDPFLYLTMDPRLLYKLLRGSEDVRFSDARLGSHVRSAREPDVREPAIDRVLDAYHA
jgi:UDP-MurNAc hydroxylase